MGVAWDDRCSRKLCNSADASCTLAAASAHQAGRIAPDERWQAEQEHKHCDRHACKPSREGEAAVAAHHPLLLAQTHISTAAGSTAQQLSTIAPAEHTAGCALPAYH